MMQDPGKAGNADGSTRDGAATVVSFGPTSVPSEGSHGGRPRHQPPPRSLAVCHPGGKMGTNRRNSSHSPPGILEMSGSHSRFHPTLARLPLARVRLASSTHEFGWRRFRPPPGWTCVRCARPGEMTALGGSLRKPCRVSLTAAQVIDPQGRKRGGNLDRWGRPGRIRDISSRLATYCACGSAGRVLRVVSTQREEFGMDAHDHDAMVHDHQIVVWPVSSSGV
jgi:hypothetical protein